MDHPRPTPADPAGVAGSLYVSLVTETFPPEINGVANTLRQMRDGLSAAGHQVQLVRPRRQDDTGAGDLVLTTGLPIPGYPGLRFGMPAGARLRELWQERRPDIVYIATEGPLGRSALAAARRLGIPVLSGMHTHFDRYSRHYRMGFVAPLVARYLRAFHNRCDGTLVPTRTMARDLGGHGFAGVRVWPRGVDAGLFDPARRSETLRRAWGLEPQQLALIHVGRLAPEKNVELALQTYLAIRAELPSTRMIWVGDGPARRRLEKACPDAIFAGARSGEDLATHYASGDLFLFPSLTETFGNVVLEAMASGLPVLAYRDAAAAELIRNGENGHTVKPDNRLDFLTSAMDLAMDPDRRRRLGRSARQQALRHDWPHLIRELVRLFKQTTAAADRIEQHGAAARG